MVISLPSSPRGPTKVSDWSHSLPGKDSRPVGDPAKRDPARIAHDLAEGLVTPEQAALLYGVAAGTEKAA